MIKETQQQKDAKTIGLNISLSANAGTGKTTVLVDRYMSLLESGIDINEIAAITFTKKAASEMIERVTKQIDDKITELLHSKKSNPSKLAHYIQISNNINTINISTIHSFCTKILREYAIESNLGVDFRQLSDVDKFKLEQDSINHTLNTLFENIDISNNNNYYINLLFGHIHRTQINKYISCLLNRPDIFDDIACMYDDNSNNENDIYDKYEELVLKNYYNFTKEFVDNFIDVLSKNYNQIIRFKYVSDSIRTEILCAIDDLLNAYKQFSTSDCSTIDMEKYLILTNNIVMLSKVKIGNYYFTNKLRKNYNQDVIKILGEDLELKNLKLYFYLCREIIRLTKTVQRNVFQQKQQLNAIDFDDTLVLTRKLFIKNPVIASIISSKYKEIMIDEFQDTNAVQYDIIKALVPKLSDSQANLSPNIFIVGDPKQSIYRFRNADVYLFNTAISDIAAANQNNNKALNLNNGNLELTATFRTLPVITGFINKVCRDLFDTAAPGSNIHYSDLVCGRDWEKYASINEGADLTGEFGSINFLISKESSNNDTDNEATTSDTISEGKLIVNEIKTLISAKKYSYSDIAIIYRSRTSVDKLKKVLDDNNIQYVEQDGTGFYQSPEIIHIVNYLKFLSNIEDDIALVGLLTSPFFVLSSNDLFQIRAMNKETFWESLLQYSKQYQDDRISSICETLQKQLVIVSQVSIVHLISSILHNKQWISRMPLLKSKQAKTQFLNNIDTFIKKARKFHSKGFVGLNDFLQDIHFSEKLNVKDTVIVGQSTSAVNLLTIHSAKGLEFPVVFLYNLNSKSNNNIFPVTSKTVGLGIPLPDINKYNSTKETFVSTIIKNQEAALNSFEDLRLLYVAMTRAKDMLYFVADCSTEHTNSMLSLIVKSFDNSSIKQFIAKYQDTQSIDSQINIKVLNNNPAGVNANIKINFKYCENISDELDNVDINNISLEQEQTTQEHIHLYTDIVHQKNQILSFSGLNETNEILNWNNNVLQKNIKKKLRIDNLSTFNTPTINDNNNYIINDYIEKPDSNHATKKGVLYHNLLTNINMWYTNNNVNKQLLSSFVENELGQMPDLTISKTIILNTIDNVVNTKLIQTYTPTLDTAKFEYSLTLPIEDNFLTGIIDCLIQNVDGIWEIWDWKTNRIVDDNRKHQLEETYKLQLELYIYLLMHTVQEQPQYTARLLFIDLAIPQAEDSLWTYSITMNIQDKDKLAAKFSNKISTSLIHVI